MWKDYSWSYIKNNRTSSISVIIAAFISALLLSLLCSLFYNFWVYEIDRLKLEEGDWQARISGEIGEDDLVKIQNFANVENVVVNRELSDGQETVVDIYFKNMRKILEDTPRIAALLEGGQVNVSYHHSLLNMYLVRDPQDPAPRAIFPFLLAMTLMACVSLIMIIHNSFAVTMGARIHQFGIFSSIGATPKQIRICLLQEAAALCAIPIVMGNVFGIAASKGIIEGTNAILTDASGRMDAIWRYHPLLLAVSLFITVITIWISAWIPARKMAVLTPLEAIKNTGELSLKRKKNSRILSLLFGIEGELVGNALKAQRKNLRTATLALLISFSAFFMMQCFFTLTGISQRMTYFQRYQDAWDVMVTVKDKELEAFEETDLLQDKLSAGDCVVYQKAEAKRLLTEKELSDDLAAAGGLDGIAEKNVTVMDGAWLVNVPIVIMDDASFLAYCGQIGVEARLDGAVILNRINDSTNPNFRVRNYIPYLNENQMTTALRQAGEEIQSVEIPVLGYTQTPPVLKEAYDELDYSVLVHFLPLSVWREIKEQIGGLQRDTYIRVIAEDGATLEQLNKLQEEIAQMIGDKYEIESENRIQDELTNDEMIDGMMLIFGGFCALLAMIGIGNVFSNTLGFVHQRKREFARYMSVGLTPQGVKKIFCLEALVMVGKPVGIALCLTAIVIGLMIKTAYLEPMIFVREMPVRPMAGFLLIVLLIVSFAYYLGGRKVLKSSLVDALRDDTML